MEYRRETFYLPQGLVSFWVPEGQTAVETMRLLLKAYEEVHQESPPLQSDS